VVESRLPKPLVAGSIPVSRSKAFSIGRLPQNIFRHDVAYLGLLITWVDYADKGLPPICCAGLRGCHVPERQRSPTNRNPQA
jgi:hypothetical protein